MHRKVLTKQGDTKKGGTEQGTKRTKHAPKKNVGADDTENENVSDEFNAKKVALKRFIPKRLGNALEPPNKGIKKARQARSLYFACSSSNLVTERENNDSNLCNTKGNTHLTPAGGNKSGLANRRVEVRVEENEDPPLNWYGTLATDSSLDDEQRQTVNINQIKVSCTQQRTSISSTPSFWQHPLHQLEKNTHKDSIFYSLVSTGLQHRSDQDRQQGDQDKPPVSCAYDNWRDNKLSGQGLVSAAARAEGRPTATLSARAPARSSVASHSTHPEHAFTVDSGLKGGGGTFNNGGTTRGVSAGDWVHEGREEQTISHLKFFQGRHEHELEQKHKLLCLLECQHFPSLSRGQTVGSSIGRNFSTLRDYENYLSVSEEVNAFGGISSSSRPTSTSDATAGTSSSLILSEASTVPSLESLLRIPNLQHLSESAFLSSSLNPSLLNGDFFSSKGFPSLICVRSTIDRSVGLQRSQDESQDKTLESTYLNNLHRFQYPTAPLPNSTFLSVESAGAKSSHKSRTSFSYPVPPKHPPILKKAPEKLEKPCDKKAIQSQKNNTCKELTSEELSINAGPVLSNKTQGQCANVEGKVREVGTSKPVETPSEDIESSKVIKASSHKVNAEQTIPVQKVVCSPGSQVSPKKHLGKALAPSTSTLFLSPLEYQVNLRAREQKVLGSNLTKITDTEELRMVSSYSTFNSNMNPGVDGNSPSSNSTFVPAQHAPNVGNTGGFQLQTTASTSSSQAQHKSVVPDLMEVYDALTQSSTPQALPGTPNSGKRYSLPNMPTNGGNSNASDANQTSGTNKRTSTRRPPRHSESQSSIQSDASFSEGASQTGSGSGEMTKSGKRKAASKSGPSLVSRSSSRRPKKPKPSDGGGGKAKKEEIQDSLQQELSGRKKGKTSNSDQRWSKRFTWPDELHRDFVAAIFDVGLKHSSPSAIMEHMHPNTDVTSERVKSHLQKYRLNRQKSRKEFMASYDSALEGFQKRQQQKQERRKQGLREDEHDEDGETDSAFHQNSFGCAEAAALCTHAMKSESRYGSDASQDDVQECHDSGAKLAPSSMQEKFSSTEPDGGTSSSIVGQPTEGQMVEGGDGISTIHLPLLTAEERDSPLGQSFGYLVGMFQTLSQQLEMSRQQNQMVVPSNALSSDLISEGEAHPKNQTDIYSHGEYHQNNQQEQPQIAQTQHHQDHSYQSQPSQQYGPGGNYNRPLQATTLEQAAANAASIHSNDPTMHEVAATIPHSVPFSQAQVHQPKQSYVDRPHHQDPQLHQQIAPQKHHEAVRQVTHCTGPHSSQSHGHPPPAYGYQRASGTFHHPQTHAPYTTPMEHSNLQHQQTHNPPSNYSQPQFPGTTSYHHSNSGPGPPGSFVVLRTSHDQGQTHGAMSVPSSQATNHFAPSSSSGSHNVLATSFQPRSVAQNAVNSHAQHKQVGFQASMVPCPLDTHNCSHVSNAPINSAPPQSKVSSQSNFSTNQANSALVGPPRPPPATHSPGSGRTLQAQKESKMMKQEMQSQKAFQNKMRALKQIELSKYGGGKDAVLSLKANSFGEEASVPFVMTADAGKHEQAVSEHQHGNDEDETPSGEEAIENQEQSESTLNDSSHCYDQKSSDLTHPINSNGSKSREQAIEKKGEAANLQSPSNNPHSTLQPRPVMDASAHEFWNPDEVDDQLFDFLMEP